MKEVASGVVPKFAHLRRDSAEAHLRLVFQHNWDHLLSPNFSPASLSMPCRAAKLYRAQEQCLWITDDILANAWNRFARLSHTTNVRTRGRRHGSNVPGPLEAHRRLSKRRMALAAKHMGGRSPSFDLGVLLGFAPFGSNRRMDDWKYEPPGLKTGHSVDSSWEHGWRAMGDKGWEQIFKLMNAFNAPQLPIDRTAESRTAFEKVLSAEDLPDEIEPVHLRSALDFLQSADDEPAARNVERLAQWLTSKPSSPAALQLFLDLVLEKTRLHTLVSSEISSVLSCCLRHPFAGQASATISSVILAAEQANAICVSVTQTILDSIVDSESRIVAPSALLDFWLRCLRQCDEIQGSATSLPYHDIFTILAERIHRPTVLADHLSTLPEDELTKILLTHWVPRFMALSYRRQPGEGLSELIGSSAGYKTCLPPPEVSGHVKCRYETFMKDPRHERQPLVALLAALNVEKSTRAPLSHEILEILLQGHPARVVYFHFRHFSEFNIRISIDLTQRLVQALLDADDLPRAWNVFKTNQAVPLSTCHELPLRLVRTGTCTSAHIWQILKRQTFRDKIRMAKRARPEMSLLPRHIDLIHQVAFAYAESPHVTPRKAIRRVWECYVFLRDRYAPIAPLLARAMVIAGVSRYLREDRRPPGHMLTYVLAVVAQCEGEEVADALDKTIWRVWKETVEPRARAIRSSENADEEFETMRILEFTPTRRYRQQREWLRWDEDHWRGSSKGEIPAIGTNFGQPREGVVETASLTYDALMTAARALQRTQSTEAQSPIQGFEEHIVPGEITEEQHQAHSQNDNTAGSRSPYKPM